MLACTVCRTYETDWLVGVELDIRPENEDIGISAVLS